MAHLYQFLLEKTEKKLRASAKNGSSQHEVARVRARVGVAVSFFSKFLSLNFCRYSPVLLFSNDRASMSSIYGGNLSKKLKILRNLRKLLRGIDLSS